MATSYFESRLKDWRSAVRVGALLLAVQVPMDWLYPSPLLTVAVRAAWAGLLLAAPFLLRAEHPRLARATAYTVGLVSGIGGAAIVALSGGSSGPRFGFLVGYPLVILVLAPDLPWTAALMGVGTLTGGIAILLREGRGAWFVLDWITLSVMATLLAVQGTLAFRRLWRSQLRAREEREEAVEQARRFAASGRIAASVAHRMNNPLAVVKASAQFLLAAPGVRALDPDAVEALEDSVRQVDRTAFLVEALRVLGAPPQPAPIDVRAAARQALLAASRLSSRIAVDSADVSESPVALADERRTVTALTGILLDVTEAAPSLGLATGALLGLRVGIRGDRVAIDVGAPRPADGGPAPAAAGTAAGWSPDLSLAHELVAPFDGSVRAGDQASGEGCVVVQLRTWEPRPPAPR